MTDPTNIGGMDEDLALAGELALRILSPEDEAAARAREAADPAFAAHVGDWNERLGGLADGIVSVEPSPWVWPSVEAALTPPAAANDNSVVFWRRWAVGSTGLLAASLAAVVVLLAQPAPVPIAAPAPPPAVIRVATLTLENGAAAMTLAYDAGTGELYLAPTTEMAGDTRVPHLWLVMPEGGVQLVGAIDGSATSRHHLGQALFNPAGTASAVAVSMEAPGHTPAPNKPDGPVVAQGAFQRL
ncbi:anti-sigma factor domain-containing protein [Brevundimonas sp.]|uniref:anti-sigma factor n=1 Tax=Brevundimonas sp. TaxID=1871086 RepID=UPI002731F49F|nr:anti-sigma factor [Brevundimonas sp.]MDP1913964.1 anti-sigma factor [Brevundimonas sp.]